MTFALPLLISTILLDQIMNMFVVGGMNMLVPVQIAFTSGITAVVILSCVLTMPAIIVSALRGPDNPHGQILMPV